jgi:hypothetical protein
MHKLGARSVAHAVMLAFQGGVLKFDEGSLVALPASVPELQRAPDRARELYDSKRLHRKR